MKDEIQAAVIFPIFSRQRDLGLTLGGVAVLMSTQMVLTNVAAPFWGIIADRGLLQRRSILTLGCLGDAWNGQWPNFWVGGSVGFRHDQT
jgi:MFS family permease